ncbi:MAG: DUF1146 family protein [Turicibacter sp.]
MNIEAYFTIVWYIIMLPIVFKTLLALRLEELFKKGATVEIKLLYILLTVCISKLFVEYFLDIFMLVKEIF